LLPFGAVEMMRNRRLLHELGRADGLYVNEKLVPNFAPRDFV
jgi:hypothetical protein